MNTLKEKRLAAGMTQKELALRIGVNKASIGAWERGLRAKPWMYKKLAEGLNCSIDELLPEEGHNPLKKKRIESGLTILAVCQKTGYAECSIIEWENGKTTPLDDKLIRLATVYGCTADELDVAAVPASGIRKMRLRAGLTRKQLAAELSVSQNTVYYWEMGNRTVTGDRLFWIAKTLNCSIDELGLTPLTNINISVEERNAYFEQNQKIIYFVMENNRSILNMVGADNEDTFQELALMMLHAIDIQDASRGKRLTYVRTTLDFGVRRIVGEVRAHGIHGLEKVPWHEKPVVGSIEAMTEAGFQFAASIDHY